MGSEHGERANDSGAEAGATTPAPQAGQTAGGQGAKPVVRKSAATPSRVALLSLILLAALASLFVYLRHRRELLSGLKAGAEKAKEVLTGQPSAPRDPYSEAVSEVEADRGEASGRSAQVEVPAELKQYKEPRRFLAIQSAAAEEAGIKPPHDFAELAGVIKAGRDLVEAPRLGRGYVLYGVGLTATGELTHYDVRAKKSVPLFANADEVNSYAEGLAADRTRLEAELKDLDGRLKEVGRKDRAERARLLSESAAKKRELSGLKEKEEVVAAYYGKAAGARGGAARDKAADKGSEAGKGSEPARDKTPGSGKAAGKSKTAGKGKTASKAADAEKSSGKGRGVVERAAGGTEKAAGSSQLFAEYEVLAGLAADFGGRSYDLHDRASAREFQARLLSFIRPAALSVLEELGTAYQSKFDRPLPVTSLVRTEEYQRLLRESGNPNAADVAPPPHTTGLAFDIYYRFMTASEQEFVMGEIARLERDGRVEALRELRDHYHVFVFPEGHGPDEKTVDKILRGRGRKG